MSRPRSIMLALLLSCGSVSAQSPGNSAPAKDIIASPGAQAPGKPVPTTEENPILKGAGLKTDWVNIRNPFRFEVNDTPAYAPERVEQMRVLGYSKMPDETGILRTYAFVAKTTDGGRADSNKPEGKAAKDLHILQALPEKLDEQTVTTEEQTDESSIMLGGEQIWFLGVLQTNGQAVAMFIQDSATYPIKEEDLRPFEIQDSLKELHVRSTKAGEKITTENSAPSVLSRRKVRNTPAKAGAVATALPSRAPASAPVPKANEKAATFGRSGKAVMPPK